MVGRDALRGNVPGELEGFRGPIVPLQDKPRRRFVRSGCGCSSRRDGLQPPGKLPVRLPWPRPDKRLQKQRSGKPILQRGQA
jgi:hypothetical protein